MRDVYSRHRHIPQRSEGGQLWLFWAAPILGAVAGGALYRGLFDAKPERAARPGQQIKGV